MRAALLSMIPLFGLVLAGCTRSGAALEPSPSPVVTERRFYNSEVDARDVWRMYSSEGPGGSGARFSLGGPGGREPGVVTLDSVSGAPMGLNMRVPAVRGRVEFEYQIAKSEKPFASYEFFILPMQNSPESSAPIEVGSSVPGDPRNATSPFRIKFVAPASKADGEWHPETIEFNFTGLPGAGYAIIAPRINEGTPTNNPGRIQYRKIAVFVSD